MQLSHEQGRGNAKGKAWVGASRELLAFSPGDAEYGIGDPIGKTNRRISGSFAGHLRPVSLMQEYPLGIFLPDLSIHFLSTYSAHDGLPTCIRRRIMEVDMPMTGTDYQFRNARQLTMTGSGFSSNNTGVSDE